MEGVLRQRQEKVPQDASLPINQEGANGVGEVRAAVPGARSEEAVNAVDIDKCQPYALPPANEADTGARVEQNHGRPDGSHYHRLVHVHDSRVSLG